MRNWILLISLLFATQHESRAAELSRTFSIPTSLVDFNLADTTAIRLASGNRWEPVRRVVRPSGEQIYLAPSVRSSASVIVDAPNHRAILFGGGANGGYLNDLWTLDLADSTATWQPLAAAGGSPPERTGHTAIFDPVRNRMIVFGGCGFTQWRNDIWSLSLSGTPTWTQLSPFGPAPPVRYLQSAIYDPVRDRMLMLGGLGASFIALNDLWSLDLSTTTWSHVSTTPAPRARDGQFAFYDGRRDQMVIYGGNFSGDLYSLNLSGQPAWGSISTGGATLPPGRSYFAAGYDSVRDRMLIFAGYGPGGSGGQRSDSWQLDFSQPTPTWSPLTAGSPTPTSRYGPAGAWDAAGSRLLVFGGRDNFLSDSWALSADSVLRWVQLSPGTQVTAPLPPATLGRYYSVVFQQTGGAPPYQWSLSSGSLPPGLGLSSSGELSGVPTLVGHYTFTVQERDNHGAIAQKPVSLDVVPTPLIINIPPTLGPAFADSLYTITLTATGGIQPITWALDSGALPAGLNLTSSGVLTGIPTEGGDFNFGVRATDHVGTTTVAQLAFHVTVFPLVVASPSPLPVGYFEVQYQASLIAVGGIHPYSWAVTAGTLPGGLAMDSQGRLSGVPEEPGSAQFTVQVSDHQGTLASKDFSLPLQVLPLSISTPTALPIATQFLHYQTALAATGGRAPYTWSLTQGALPDSFSLSASGVLSGIAQLPGNFDFTVTVRDTTGRVDSKALHLQVVLGPAITTTAPIATGPVGQSYIQTLTAIQGVQPYSWSIKSGVLPTGMFLSRAGTISGTATSPGSSSFVVGIMDAQGAPNEAGYTIEIQNGSLLLSIGQVISGSVGRPYSSIFSPSGGTPPYAVSLISGTLPPGLTLDPSGSIAGTPTSAGTFCFSLQVLDNAGGHAYRSYALLIDAGAPKVLTTSLPEATVGQAYSQALQGSGGTPPYQWHLTAGVFPSGITLFANGVISGSPQSAGNSAITVRLLDAGGGAAFQNLTLVSLPALAFLDATPLPEGFAGVPYPVHLRATGGKPPYNWSVASGALPSGLSLLPDGSFSGSPQAGSSSFTLAITDANAGTISSPFALSVGPMNPLLAPPHGYPTGSGPNALVAADFNQDGSQDLAVADYGQGAGTAISLLLGAGDGSFVPHPDIPTGQGPFALASGDLDGSGHPRLAVTNLSASLFSVLSNVSGVLDGSDQFYVANPPAGIAIGDFDGDGLQDIVVSIPATSSAIPFVNSADGGFSQGTSRKAGSNPVALATGDLNGDGHPDVVTANSAGNSVSVLISNGNGTLKAKVDYPVPAGPVALSLGDADGDGHLDLAVVSPTANTVSFLRGTGTGTFGARSDFSVGRAPSSVVLRDLDGDGFPDLVVANGGDNSVSVLRGHGDGTFDARVEFPVGENPTCVVVLDLNKDGLPDLAACNQRSNTVSILLNSGAGFITPVRLSDTEASAGPEGIRISWAAHFDGSSVFKVFRSEDPGQNFAAVSEEIPGAAGQGQFAYVDRSAEPGHAYAYQIGYRQGAGVWSYSSRISIHAARAELSLAAPVPNPTSGSSQIRFVMPAAGPMELSIYSVDGKRVRVLESGPTRGGAHTATWDGLDASGMKLSSGAYFVRLTAGARSLTRKLVLLN